MGCHGGMWRLVPIGIHVYFLCQEVFSIGFHVYLLEGSGGDNINHLDYGLKQTSLPLQGWAAGSEVTETVYGIYTRLFVQGSMIHNK